MDAMPERIADVVPAAAVATTCPVCCDAYTPSLRRPIECANCEYAACTSCCKTYLTTVEDAACKHRRRVGVHGMCSLDSSGVHDKK
jgi:hypothetical protein